MTTTFEHDQPSTPPPQTAPPAEPATSSPAAVTEVLEVAEVSQPGVQSDRTGPASQAPNGQARARARESSRRAAQAGLKWTRRFTGAGWLSSTPASVQEVLAYTRAGGWIPGERAQWLEKLGQAYGFLVAVPVTAAAFLAVWFIQRPTRLVFGVALWAGLRWAL